MRRETGFTLLEVLVALVIASLAMGVLFSGALASMRSVRLSSHYQEAMSRARSRMAAVDVGGLHASVQEGDDGGGFRWRVRIAPIASVPIGSVREAADLVRAPRVELFAVLVAISWNMDGMTRQVELQTQRVGAALRPPP